MIAFVVLSGLVSNEYYGMDMCSDVTHLLLEGNIWEGMVVEVVPSGGEQINEHAGSTVI